MSFDEHWVSALKGYLDSLIDLNQDDAPMGDIMWLSGRCGDTLRYFGVTKTESMENLLEEVRSFVKDFPGWIPNDLVPPEI